MTEEEFKKYEGRQTTGTKGKDVLSGGKIIGYDPNSGHHLQLFAIDDNLGDCGKSYRCVIPNKEDYNDWLLDKHKYIWVSIDNVIMDEQKELDLTEILKGCEGVELWSNVFGLCKLERIIETVIHPIVLSITNNVGVNISECISKDGLYNNAYNGECILWPSETNRDWSTFKKPIKVNDDDWVVALTYTDKWFTVCKYGDLDITKNWKYIIPYNKFDITLNGSDLKRLSII